MTLKPPKKPTSPTSADANRDRFWRTLSQEFAFDHQQDSQMEQHLQAITETWMICTGDLFERPTDQSIEQPKQSTLP